MMSRLASIHAGSASNAETRELNGQFTRGEANSIMATDTRRVSPAALSWPWNSPVQGTATPLGVISSNPVIRFALASESSIREREPEPEPWPL